MSVNVPIPEMSIKAGQVTVTSHRLFSRKDDDGPIPAFTNAIEFGGLGADIFMDIGIVTPEAVNAALAKHEGADGPVAVDVYIQHRFSMSLQTAIQTHQKLAQLIASSPLMMPPTTSPPPVNG